MSPDDCYLSSVCVDRTVSEQLLNKDDRPMLLLDQLREESARISQFTRFELRFVEDPPTGPSVSLFVGNLKENLSQRLYERVLLDKLGEKCRWDSIEVIYYESGCLVLNYHSSEKAEQAYELLNVFSEQLLNKDDRPMLLLDQLREESARISQFTRFELRFVEDPPTGPSVSLFVGNLKENLSQRLYERVLLDKLGEKCRWDSIEVIYYESGCLVLNYHSSEKAEQAYELLNLREESARISQFTRFELRFVEDPPTGPSVSLFVGNLKENLSQRLYERVLLDKLGEKCRWDSIEVIYYESGCLVLNYHSSEKAEQAYELLNESIFMNKPLTALLLPTIRPQNLPKGIQPLLVFVNLKSGGCQGVDLIVAFRRLLNPFQVFNLDYGGPLPGLYCFRHLASYKILVCGGDGTVGWTLSCLDIVGQDAACNAPPIAPLPLGTGNDLSRVLRWGSGYSSADDPLTILKDVVAAEEVKLDRWTLIVRPEEDFKDETKLALELQTNASNTNEDNSIMIIMNNYFGIGIDADLSLDFHNARSENPSKFNSRIHNKGVYFKIGLRKIINRTICKDLHKQIVVIADGKIVILPPIEGLVVLNILSWGGGANPWNVEKHDDEFVKPTHYDGLLEVVGISGVVHMGQIYSGLGTGIRLAQAAHLKIWLKSELPIHVDGEPFIHPPGQITVLRSALSANMLRKVKRPKRRPGTEDYGLNQLSSTTDQYQKSTQQYSTIRLHDFNSSDYSSLNVIQNIKEDLKLPTNKLNMNSFISDTPTYSKPIINLTSKPIYNNVNIPTNTLQSSTVSVVHSNDDNDNSQPIADDTTAVYHQGSLTNTLNQLSLGSNIRSQEILSSSSSANLSSSLLRICSYTTLSGDDSV
ncbi:unnamed protein product [Schistosoma spindalis]|nr:unnamed protein product [Schistosoma spindale]